MNNAQRIRTLITRLARLDAAETWAHDINPTQAAVLDYLSVANQFSRSPSHVASFLGSTRGTVSQTLKSLQSKGYIHDYPSELDRRTISYRLTDLGRTVTTRQIGLDRIIQEFGDKTSRNLEQQLGLILENALRANNGRAFGICRNCTHFEDRGDGGYCGLLSVDLDAAAIHEICHEQIARPHQR